MIKKLGRTLVTCGVCKKYTIHFGLGMCNSCIRNYKRKTRPIFYLGTQYSEIKRRCTTPNTVGRNYYGKKFCSKEEYIARFINDKAFLKQYRIWQESDYKRGSAPSIDRIDNNGDYTIDNLQMLSNIANCKKSKGMTVILIENDKEIIFESQADLAKYIGVCQAYISCVMTGKRKNKTGFNFRKLKNEAA